jgi:galactose mutarotase-like enzyme
VITHLPMPPTGEQYEIASGDARAVVTGVGAGLRAFEQSGRACIETFDAAARPFRGSGTVLVPWPNRTARGRWDWRGREQQLALSEPAAGDSATDDCTLTLAAATALPLDGGLPTGPERPVDGDLDFRGGQPLRGRVLDNAFGACVPADGDAVVRHRLAGPDGAVELWADPDFGWVQVFTPDDHPERGRVVAVEPMTCPPDALNSGIGLRTVEPGGTWTGSWGIRGTWAS